MPSETKIKIDGGTLIKSDDGKVNLGKNAGCVSWLAVVNSGILMLGFAAMILWLVISRFLDPNDHVSWEEISELLVLILFLGYVTFYLYNKTKRGKTTIDPAAKLIKIGRREISFIDVETIISKSSELPLMEGAVLITFYAALNTGELESLGSISGEPEKIEARVTQILTILSEAIMGQSHTAPGSDMTMTKNEDDVRHGFESQLNTDETLLAFTVGEGGGWIAGQSIYIGLTEFRLILLPTLNFEKSMSQKGRNFLGKMLYFWTFIIQRSVIKRPYGFRRKNIKSFQLKGTGFSPKVMEINFSKDKLNIAVRDSRWKKRAQELIELANQVPLLPGANVATERQNLIQQAQDFRELGFHRSAQQVLTDAFQDDPALRLDPTLKTLQKQLAETKLAFRVGAGFLFAYVGVITALTALLILTGQDLKGFLNVETVVSVFVTLWLGVQLWRGTSDARNQTIVAVIIGLLYVVANAFGTGDYVGLIIGASFSGAIVLVLTGNSGRRRTGLAVALYAVGYLGVLTLSILFWQVRSLAVKPQTFTGDNFALTYPGSWQTFDISQEEFCKQTNPKCLFAITHPSGDGTYIMVTRFSLNRAASVEDVDNELWSQAESRNPGIVLETQQTIKIDQRDSIERIVTLPSDTTGKQTRILQWHIVDGLTLYEITAFVPNSSAYGQYKTDIEKIASGLDIAP